MNILIIKNAEWNDVTFANNLLTNWFDGVEANFANIYCGPGLPLNQICDKYFQITDAQLLKSFFFIEKAGKEIQVSDQSSYINHAKENASRKGLYGFFKKLSIFMHTPIMLIRDFLWMRGRYNEEGLRIFIENFNPDIILSYRVFNPQIYKLERLVYKYATVPMVAYTGDDEVFNDSYSFFGLSQLRKNYTRYLFAKQESIYSHYLTHSLDLCGLYTSKYGIPASVIHKGGVFSDSYSIKSVNSPIKMIYAGRICYGRWKTLVEIGKSIDDINRNGSRIQLYVYTPDVLSRRINSEFKSIDGLVFCGSVTGEELKGVYKDGDIALHVESFDRKYSQGTLYSFSTKIVDLMNSTCAILAVCDENQSGFKYLKENNAAFTASSFETLYDTLLEIVNNPYEIGHMAKTAWELGKKNHDKSRNQKTIMALLSRIVDEKSKELK